MSRPIRRHIHADRPPSSRPGPLEPVRERRVVLHSDGAVEEYEIVEGFACSCPSDGRSAAGRCAGCHALFCDRCPNVSHTMESELRCGRCSRLVLHGDGRLQRLSKRDFWRLRVCRWTKALVWCIGSPFIDRGERG